MIQGDEDDLNPYQGKPALKFRPFNLIDGVLNEEEN